MADQFATVFGPATSQRTGPAKLFCGAGLFASATVSMRMLLLAEFAISARASRVRSTDSTMFD